MCGIVGVISGRNVSQILLDSIKKLEYRGYDSVGIATINNNQISIKKDVGKINEVDKKLNLSRLAGTIGLVHTRWATTGGVTRANSHPHTDCKNKIAIIHNGIIENHAELKKGLKGHNFKSETDTEVIAHLIEDNYSGNLKEAVIKSLKQLEGSYALGIIHKDHNELIAVRNESPLVIG